MDNYFYKVIINKQFIQNDPMLTYVYGPIIGLETVNLYRLLIEDEKMQKDYQSGGFNISRIANLLQIKTNQILIARQKLEAIGLLNTLITKENESSVIFEIIEPLSWNRFKENIKKMNLFKEKVRIEEYDRTRYYLENNLETSSLINISSNFDEIYNEDNKLNNLNTFNFNPLYDAVFKKINILMIFTTKTKQLIINYSRNNDFSTIDLTNIILKSIFKINNNCQIDEKLLELNLEKFNKLSSLTVFKYNLKINRNAKIFLEEIAQQDYCFILHDYKTINSIQYLSSIQKKNLDESEYLIIKNLRENYCLPDFLINILIDYSIMRNNGRIVANYMEKIALTINRLKIEKAESFITHLRNNNNFKRFSTISSTTRVNWDE